VREHTKSRLKSHFILPRARASLHTGWRDSIDRQIGPADYRRTRGGSTCLRVSRPHFENGLYFNLRARRYIHMSVARVPIAGAPRTLTHLHRRTFVTRLWTIALIGPGELLIAGARRIWLSIASFAERTFLISSGIPSVGLGLKSDAVFSTYILYTYIHACVHIRAKIHPCENVDPRANEREST